MVCYSHRDEIPVMARAAISLCGATTANSQEDAAREIQRRSICMAKMSYVKIFLTFRQDMERLNYEERGRLITAILLYADTGEEMDLPGPEGILWPNSKRLIDDEQRSYENKCRKNRENAKKSTKTRKKAGAASKNQRSPANVCQEQEKEQEHEQEHEQEYFETVVSKENAPGGAHDGKQTNFVWEGYGEELCGALSSWLTYKEERGQHYRKTGFDALKAQVDEAVRLYGEDAVAAVIRRSMAANYHCITFDRLRKEAAQPQFGYPHPGSAAPSPADREDAPGDEYSRMVEEYLQRQR